MSMGQINKDFIIEESLLSVVTVLITDINCINDWTVLLLKIPQCFNFNNGIKKLYLNLPLYLLN